MILMNLSKRCLRLPLVTSMLVAASCSSLAMEPCEDYRVLNLRTPGTVRVRTEHYRAMIREPALAAGRFLPYALMSAYAYRVPLGCPDDPGKPPRVDPDRAEKIKQALLGTTGGINGWTERDELSIQSQAGPVKFGCEDSTGLMYNVWDRQAGDQMFVVVAFRGTSGGKNDWIYGNMWWFTRLLPSDNQYVMARAHMRQIFNYYEAQAQTKGMRAPRFITTGHSLGGGIAQHMLYAFPNRIEQVIAFNPTPVTASVDVSKTAKEVGDCSCLPKRLKDLGANLGSEARILRVYFDYEILSDLRLPHKVFLGLLPYVQEVTFNLSGSWNQISRHSMGALADAIYKASGDKVAYTQGDAWLTSKNSVCTRKLIEEQPKSCKKMSADASIGMCPI